MKGEAKSDIERHPGQVEERCGPAAGQKAADLIQIAKRLQPLAAIAGPERQPDDRIEDAATEELVEPCANAGQHACAHDVEHALERVEHRHKQNECDKRRHAAARQDAIIDLQHEQRARQHQDVDDAAEAGDGYECAAVGQQRAAKVRPVHGRTRRIRRKRRKQDRSPLQPGDREMFAGPRHGKDPRIPCGDGSDQQIRMRTACPCRKLGEDLGHCGVCCVTGIRGQMNIARKVGDQRRDGLVRRKLCKSPVEQIGESVRRSHALPPKAGNATGHHSAPQRHPLAGRRPMNCPHGQPPGSGRDEHRAARRPIRRPA